jgi:hypothetical protein
MFLSLRISFNYHSAIQTYKLCFKQQIVITDDILVSRQSQVEALGSTEFGAKKKKNSVAFSPQANYTD